MEAQRLQYEFEFSTNGNYYANEHGRNEKTIRSKTLDAWCVILETGEILNADKGFVPIGKLNKSYWDDPTKLCDALKAADAVFEEMDNASVSVLAQEESIAEDSVVDEARRLQERFGFKSTGDLYENDVEYDSTHKTRNH